MDNIMKEAERFLKGRREALTAQLRDQATEDGQVAEGDARDRAEEREQVDIRGALTDRERLELREVDAALARLAGGTYGHCETCGKAIGLQRLRAVPEARCCVACSVATAPAVARHG